jgi:hypothetical protein
LSGFATVKAVEAAFRTCRHQRCAIYKPVPTGMAANAWFSWWKSAGFPAAGASPTTGPANGRVCTQALAGAIPYANAPAGETLHLANFGAQFAGSGTPGASILLVDRIADVNLDQTTGVGAITGVDATSRLEAVGGPESGAQIFLESDAAQPATSNTWNITYTNQAGTAGRVTPNFSSLASVTASRALQSNFDPFVPLQAGDSGVRSIQTVTLVSGTTTGLYNLCLVRPLVIMPATGAIPLFIERDFVLEFTSMPRIFDDSCLQLLGWVSSGAVATVYGDLRLVSS